VSVRARASHWCPTRQRRWGEVDRTYSDAGAHGNCISALRQRPRSQALARHQRRRPTGCHADQGAAQGNADRHAVEPASESSVT
jgi:hypothetical protein